MEKILFSIVLFIIGNVGCYIKAVRFRKEGESLKRTMIVGNLIIVVFVVLYLTGVIWR